MTNTNTLTPCPFCGERAETDFIPEHHSYQIECSDSIGCTARITRDSELGAIEAWNCRAALAAPAQVVPAPGVEAVSEREFKQFLSDVLTAAGLVTHGKKCKDLGRRLGEMSMRLLTAPKTAAAPAQAGEYPAGTGNPEADRIICRLASSDPDFDDCADAVALIHKLVAEIKGSGGFDTWKDAAIADRVARGSAQAACVDAERYRWLFDARTKSQAESISGTINNPLPQDEVLSHLHCFFTHKAQVDEMIDAARAAQKGNHD